MSPSRIFPTSVPIRVIRVQKAVSIRIGGRPVRNSWQNATMSSKPLSPSAQRVQDVLDATGRSFSVQELEQSTRTSAEAADAVGCTVAQIVKSLVFQGKTSGAPILLLVSGSNRVNEKAVAKHTGEALKRPDAQYVRDVTGFSRDTSHCARSSRFARRSDICNCGR